jgi:hypothetical protein
MFWQFLTVKRRSLKMDLLEQLLKYLQYLLNKSSYLPYLRLYLCSKIRLQNKAAAQRATCRQHKPACKHSKTYAHLPLRLLVAVRRCAAPALCLCAPAHTPLAFAARALLPYIHTAAA